MTRTLLEPDFEVVGVGTEKQFDSYSTGWGYGSGWYGYGTMGSGMTYGSRSTIYGGQLVLDMYNVPNHDLVWRGTVSKTIDPKAKPQKQDKNILKAVAKLLTNCPAPQE